MPTFVYQRLAILGDAAHPFLPHQAQGGAQAIEDGVCLAALLPRGTDASDIPDRLELYQRQRYERSHTIQTYTRLSGADLKDGQTLDMSRFTAYNVGHDEWHSSKAALEKHLALKEPTTRWRTPIAFGPAPGPRQPLGLPLHSELLARVRSECPETSSTLAIRFKTSRTYLQRLLPPGFSYVSPATLCEATISCTTLKGLAWLGGGGYSFVMLRLHGIQYIKQNGEKVLGAFIPLIFENQTDPIITGRDDVGMPKLYAAIEPQHMGNAATVEISWQGCNFGSLAFHEFESTAEPSTNGADPVETKEVSSSTMPSDNGQLAWRYVPAVGEPGKADAQYPVFVPNADPTKYARDATVRKATAAEVHFSAKSWSQLPTLHHIARTLEEMPQYGVVAAEHIVASGVDDLRGAYRIE